MPWVKGQSGNPGGRPTVAQAIRALARTSSERAFNVVLDLMEHGDKDSTRLAAAIAILKVAGVPMSADVNITVTERQESPALTAAPTEDLASVVGIRQGTLN
jgi:HEAT repeat protein